MGSDFPGGGVECYAVANAAEPLKALATGIIGSNEEDAVAKWLAENVRIGRC